MARWSFENIRVGIALPNREMVGSIVQSLKSNGLRRYGATLDLDGLRGQLEAGDIDLLITTPDIDGTDISRMMQDYRHGHIGEDPFVVIMTLLENPSQERVAWVVDWGVDDVLLMPHSARQLAERLDNFVVSRKPFVVTHDYVGPDRRGDENGGANSAPRVEVPNPIRWQVVANSDSVSYKEKVRDASDRINIHKIKSYGRQIDFLANRIVSTFSTGTGRDGILADVEALDHVRTDLAKRLQGTNFAEVGELVDSLGAICERLSRRDRDPKAVEVEIVPTITHAIGRVFDDDPEALNWQKAAITF